MISASPRFADILAMPGTRIRSPGEAVEQQNLPLQIALLKDHIPLLAYGCHGAVLVRVTVVKWLATDVGFKEKYKEQAKRFKQHSEMLADQELRAMCMHVRGFNIEKIQEETCPPLT